MKKMWTYPPVRLLILAVAVFVFFGCGKEISPGNTEQAPGKTVKTDIGKVEIVDRPLTYEAVGTVYPRTTAVVSAKVMGEITRVTVHEGDHVKKGDLLAAIDDHQPAARLAQAKAALAAAKQSARAAGAGLASAESRYKLAQSTFKRYKSMLESESVSQQEFDEVRSRCQQAFAALSQAKSLQKAAEDRVGQAKAAVAGAETAFRDTTVRAPYDSVVTARMVDPGDLASPGTPLVKLEETGMYEVHMVLPEEYIGHIDVGGTVRVRIPSISPKNFEGAIKTIDPSADPAIRSFRVKVALPEVPGLRAGLFCRIVIPIGKTTAILIPKTAVVHHGQLTGIFIVDPENIARFHLIRTGYAFGDRVEVLSGLNAGQRYVVQPGTDIKDGVKVEAA